MSYCRFSNGDVYMYNHVGGFIECCACLFAPNIKSNASHIAELMEISREDVPELYEDFEMNGSLQFNTRTEALNHLQAHKDAGHKVPVYAFERLQKELEDEGDAIKPDNGESLIDLENENE